MQTKKFNLFITSSNSSNFGNSYSISKLLIYSIVSCSIVVIFFAFFGFYYIFLYDNQDNAELISKKSKSYNFKFLNRYKSYIDAINITFVDRCVDYGHLFNLSYYFNEIPFEVFSIGESVPDDFEVASSERILSSIFRI